MKLKQPLDGLTKSFLMEITKASHDYNSDGNAVIAYTDILIRAINHFTDITERTWRVADFDEIRDEFWSLLT